MILEFGMLSDLTGIKDSDERRRRLWKVCGAEEVN